MSNTIGWHQSTGVVSFRPEPSDDEKFRIARVFLEVPRTFIRWEGADFEALHFPDQDEKNDAAWSAACATVGL